MNPFSTERGLVFNIQKFSVHDGPGIRTAVFIKGCPLRCKWCANPESQSRRIQIMWDGRKCIRCGRCVMSCPEEAVIPVGNTFHTADDWSGPASPGVTFPKEAMSMRQSDATSPGHIHIRHSGCSGCGICVRNCPAHALTAEGEWKTAQEVLDVCLQDVDFYEESGGGVTLSGGEVLSSPDFAIALASLLHENGIHVAFETTGFAAPEIFDRVTPHADLLLFDMKHWNEAKHIEGTGVSNLPILANMKRAVAAGREVLPRIPVIPGFNDALEDAKGMSSRLHEVGIGRAQLLPFHQFGENKYASLDTPYAYAGVASLHPEDLEDYRNVFVENGIEAFF